VFKKCQAVQGDRLSAFSTKGRPRFVISHLEGYTIHNLSWGGRTAERFLKTVVNGQFNRHQPKDNEDFHTLKSLRPTPFKEDLSHVRKYFSVIIMIGSNDHRKYIAPSLQENDGADIAENYVAPLWDIFKHWVSHGGRVFFLTPPPRSPVQYPLYNHYLNGYVGRLTQLLDVGEGVHRPNKDALVQTCSPLYHTDGSWKPAPGLMHDGAHLNVQGYVLLKQFLMSLTTHNQIATKVWNPAGQTKRRRQRKAKKQLGPRFTHINE